MHILLCVLIFELISSYRKSFTEPGPYVNRDTFLISTWVSSSFFSTDYVLKDILNSSANNEEVISLQRNENFESIFKEKSSAFPYIEGLGTFDGECVFSNTTIALAGDDTSGKYCQLLRKNPGLEITADIITNKRYRDSDFLIIARSIHDQNGLFMGGALAGINLAYYDEILSKIDIYQDGFISVIDNQQRLVSRHPSVGQLRGKVLLSERLQTFIANNYREKTSTSISPVDGKKRVTTILKVANTPFFIAMGVSLERALSSWWEKFTTYSISTGIILALLIFLLKNHMQNIKLTQEFAIEARHDFLTGLPNRKYFYEASEHAISQVKRSNNPCAFLCIDLDKFKTINDLYGHAIGDKYLNAISQTIKDQIRETDVLARLGGDEFGVLLTNIQNRASVDNVIAKINRKLENPLIVNDVEHQTSASIGLSIYNGNEDEDDNFESLFSIADAAMYAEKLEKKSDSVDPETAGFL